MSYIGNNLQVAYPSYTNIDDISSSFNGVTTSFALTVGGVTPVPAPLSSNQCLISVGGVVQRPDDTGTEGFRLSSGNIVFSSAPNTGEDFFGVILAGADYVYAGQNFPDGTVSNPSITFAQDLDTGFYRSGAGEVKFTANGADAVTLSSNNLTAPSFIPTSSSVPTNGVYLSAANTVGIATNSTGRLFINASGQVGIGTTSPSAILHVREDSATSSVLRLENREASGGVATQAFSIQGVFDYDNGASAANGGRIVFGKEDTYTTSLSAVDSYLAFQTVENNTQSEKARIDSSGRLLVGTASWSGDERIVIYNNPSSSGPGYLGLATGTASPANGINLGAVIYSASDGGTAAAIRAKRDGGTWTNGTSTPTKLEFSTTADGASSPTGRWEINSSGTLVSLGPNIDNAATYSATTANSANMYVGSGGVYQRSTSSIKYKTDVETLQDKYADAVLGCRPVWYRSTCENDCAEHSWWGFIAEEVAEIDPRLVQWKTTECVAQEDGTQIKVSCDPEPDGVAYERFVPLLLNLIKRQGEAIADLQVEVAALKAQ